MYRRPFMTVAFPLLWGACAFDSTCVETDASTKSLAIKSKDENAAIERLNDVSPVLLALSSSEAAAGDVFCTATRIRPGVALTAAHCLRERQPSEVFVRQAQEQQFLLRSATNSDRDCGDSPGPEARAAERFETHPELDVALLFFEFEENTESALLQRTPPLLHSPVRLSGFGLTESGVRGQLRAISGQVIRIDTDVITVQGHNGGACLGDSGSPLLTGQEGAPIVAGVLSQGSASCWGNDYFVPVASFEDWLSEKLPTRS